MEENEVSLDLLNATIISSNFWPPIQVCRSIYYYNVHSLYKAVVDKQRIKHVDSSMHVTFPLSLH